MYTRAKKALAILLTEGPVELFRHVRQGFERLRDFRRYQIWVRECDFMTDDLRENILQSIVNMNERPLISIVMPVYNVEEQWLRRAIDTVRGQIYPHWELCIADDRSTAPHVARVLGEYAAQDSRIRVTYRETNGHISAASNSALELVTGEFAVLMDHDDELTEHALYFVAKEINEHPQTHVIYSDEDKIDTRGRRFQPCFKPDWSPELLCSLNLFTHLIAYRTSILRQCGGFRVGFEGSQDYDVALRLTAAVASENIRHIPRILYHWRTVSGSVALSADQKPYAHNRARIAIGEYLSSMGIAAKVVKGRGELHRVIYQTPGQPPLVTVVVFESSPSAKPDIAALLKGLRYPVEVVNLTRHPDTDLGNGVKVISLEAGGRSIFEDLNSAVKVSSGSVICFLDAALTKATSGWLDELVGPAMQNDVGAVGPKILFPNRKVKHAGYILGIRNGIGRPYLNYRRGYLGNYYWLVTVRNVSAVSLGCMAIRKDVFESVGCFDADGFRNAHGDIDLCLRLMEKGLRNVLTPWAEITQRGEVPADVRDEVDVLKQRHAWAFERDPYYNPNFTLEREFELAFPPRLEKY